MTAPTFFASRWLSAGMVLIETIAREGAGGRQDTTLGKARKALHSKSYLPQHRRDLGAIALRFRKYGSPRRRV